MSRVRGGEDIRKYLENLAEKVSNPGTLRVGFLSGATYPDGTSVALVAAVQNFGSPAGGIPPRPFFSNMVSKGRRSWGPVLTKILKENNYDAKKSLRQMGEVIKGELQDSIVNGSYVPLKPETVQRKGFAKPLIDTGHMLNSVDYEVT